MSHIARRKPQVIGLNSGDCVTKRRNPCCVLLPRRRTCPSLKDSGGVGSVRRERARRSPATTREKKGVLKGLEVTP